MGESFDWDKIKAEYVSLSLKTDDIKPSYFTNKYGMKYQTLMAKKKKFKWGQEVARQRRSLEAQTNKKVKSQLSTIDADEILDEIKVRKKNMQIANQLLDLLDEEWIIKIKDPKQRKALSLTGLMSGYDMVSRLRGKAAGLPEKLDVNSRNLHVNFEADGHVSPEENRKRLAESEDLAIQLQGLIKEFKEEAIEVDTVKPKESKTKRISKGKGSK